MKLTKAAIGAIDPKIRLKLALALDFTEQWIIRLINKELEEETKNSPLTTAAALKILREETGLTDQEILEETMETTKE